MGQIDNFAVNIPNASAKAPGKAPAMPAPGKGQHVTAPQLHHHHHYIPALVTGMFVFFLLCQDYNR